ncbi:NAD-dependent epimerase/dehydratase family protein [Undibacterium sp. TJN25]|uniref:NAD-dependent epimerase/dehydratase family protein n=1 Tax=Undibacterium sp. TJN25 TaxID=3413056 RepID=UPI003BEFBC09
MKPDGILIIGGTGFLGTALGRRLSRDGHQVHVLARHAEPVTVANLTMHRGSIDDVNLLRKILPFCGTIIHAASTTTPGTSIQQPSMEAMQNILPTLRLLEVLREFEERHLIFFSSGGTFYGTSANTPVSENQPFSPQSYYGAGKVAIEAFLQAYQGQGGGAVTILRPSNVYGTGQPFRPGFGIIRTMLEHAMHGSLLEIWGDGEVIRDFIFIDDLVEVCVQLIENPSLADTYNLGYGQGHSVNHVLRAIQSVCKIKLATQYMPSRQLDVKAIVLDTQRLGHLLNWRPKVQLEQGLELTWNWLKTHQQK